MKYIILYTILISSLLFACGNKNQTSAVNQDKTEAIENKIFVPVTTCYMGSMGKDSFHLKVETFENVVTGSLAYLFYEKDQQRGTFEGKFSSDTLWADYTYSSEGQTSIRQIAFLFKDGKAIEGYGDMEEKDGRMVFKRAGDLQFGSGLKLNEVPCEN